MRNTIAAVFLVRNAARNLWAALIEPGVTDSQSDVPGN
jgi:hypothetical protein